MDALDDRDVLGSRPTSNLGGTLTSDWIDTHIAISLLVDALACLPTSPPSLYLDLEGANLSRHGSVSILQIHASPDDRTFLIDIHSLGESAFSTVGASGQTLRGILESDTIPKVFFDVRNDSDALFSHYGIKLAGVHDLQLMELATRSSPRTYVAGLSKCIERDAGLSERERVACKATKEKGRNLFAPERGGSYEVFNVRPFPQDMLSYCIQDVHFMPKLWQLYNSRLGDSWAAKVQQAAKDRVATSHNAGFNGKGKHMILGPPGWK